MCSSYTAGDLGAVMRRLNAPLPPSAVCTVMCCLCRSLVALHSRSPPVTHRDVKLENLLIDDNNCVKLCDLGSATTAQHRPDEVRFGYIITGVSKKVSTLGKLH